MSAHSDPEVFLRAALHAAADSLEPQSNGLHRIQARLRRPRPSVVRWFVAAWNEIFMRAPAALQDACYWLDHAVRVVWDQLQRASTPGRHRSSNEGWIRPVILMASVMFIVAAGAYTAIAASSLIFPSNSGAQSANHSNPPAGHSGAPAPGASATHSYVPPRSKSTAAASCPPTTPASAASPAASPTGSPSPSPTPTDTSTSTDASPTDTSTASTGPTDSASPTPTQSAVPTTEPVTQAASPTPCGSS